MIEHHGGALQMARRLECAVIVAQRSEIIKLRKLLRHDGLNKPAYHHLDDLFAL